MLKFIDGDKRECSVRSPRDSLPFLIDFMHRTLSNKGKLSPEDRRIAMHDAMTRVKAIDDKGVVYSIDSSLQLRKVA